MTAVNVAGGTAVEAWREGVAKVMRDREVFDLFTTIESPTVLDQTWLQQQSPRARGLPGDDIRDVVKTIFPFDLAARFPVRADLYREYLRRHDRAMKFRRNRGTWGTYFERMIRFPGYPATNQLETAISKLISWPTRSTSALVFHLATPGYDTPRTRGGPCWHFGELVWHEDNRLDLVVVYRNHDFYNKALGNFIGLGQLLGFICEASGKSVGRLLCHSVRAYSAGTVQNMQLLRA